MLDNWKDAIRNIPGDLRDGAEVYYDAARNDNDRNVDFEGRRNAIQLFLAGATGAAAWDALDGNSAIGSAGSVAIGYVPKIDVYVGGQDENGGGGTATPTETPTSTPTETPTSTPTPEPHWTEQYGGEDFGSDLISLGQIPANATADLFETAYNDAGDIFDVSLVEADEVDHNFDNYDDLFLKVNHRASPVYDGSPNTDTLQGLGYEEDFVEDTLAVLEEYDELTRVGEEYAQNVLDL